MITIFNIHDVLNTSSGITFVFSVAYRGRMQRQPSFPVDSQCVEATASCPLLVFPPFSLFLSLKMSFREKRTGRKAREMAST